MRLLNVHTLEFEDLNSELPQPYAIASHRWERDETTFQDVQKGKNTGNAGYLKVRNLAEYVKKNVPSVDHLWIDTCCIDKKNSVELDSAINSMFQWYRESQICLAYLSDVSLSNDVAAFRASIWFQRGWTLQELLAPRTVLFLSNDWQVIGHKGKQDCSLRTGPCLNTIIAGLTGIPEAVLGDYDQSRALGVEEKLKWIDGRRTTREEDLAYCLLGIFDVSMGIRYGGVASGKKAMDRLRAKIKKVAEDSAPSTSALFVENVSVAGHSKLPMVSNQILSPGHISNFSHLADQLDKIAEKLASSYYSAANASRTVQKLASSCERLSILLRKLESFRQESFANVALLMACIESYGRSTADFRSTIENINTAITQFSIGDNTYTDCLDSEMQGWLDDLEHSKKSLDLALDIYFDKRRCAELVRTDRDMKNKPVQMSLASQQNFSVLQESYEFSGTAITRLNGHEEVSLQEDVVSRATVRRQSNAHYIRSSGVRLGKRKASKQTFRATARWTWFSSRVWSLAVTRAQSGWDIQFRVYNEVKYGTEIFKCCFEGDIAGMQRLVATGAASFRDRCGPFTLLWIAVFAGNYRSCQYLLSEMTTADRENDMSMALSHSSSMSANPHLNEAMYRLFVEDYDLDVEYYLDLDKDFHTPPCWWSQCPSRECRKIIMNNMWLPWSKRSIEERFEYATMVYNGSPHDFIELSGLQPNDERLTWLRDTRNHSAFHYVAYRLAAAVKRDSWRMHRSLDAAGDWAQFGTELLRTGVDPHYTVEKSGTAFLVCVTEILSAQLNGKRPYSYRKLQDLLKTWMTMVLDAGLSLRVYSQRENQILKTEAIRVSVPRGWPDADGQSIELSKIEYSEEPASWSLKVLEATKVPLYSLNVCPGSFTPNQEGLLPTICWPPSEEEWEEGNWVRLKTIDTQPTLVETRERSLSDPDPFISLVEKTQDDTGVVVLLTDRWPRKPAGRERSRSSPPLMACRKAAYFAPQRSKIHPWLDRYHLCPRDSQYRSGCVGILDCSRAIRDMRPCVKASPGRYTSVHESIGWNNYSFLSEIDN